MLLCLRQSKLFFREVAYVRVVSHKIFFFITKTNDAKQVYVMKKREVHVFNSCTFLLFMPALLRIVSLFCFEYVGT